MIRYTDDDDKIPYQIDEEDDTYVSSYKWHIHNGYPYRSRSGWEGGGGESLHLFLMGRLPKGFEWDHINRDKLDNRKENLRALTIQENRRNKNSYKKTSSSDTCSTGHKGVYNYPYSDTPFMVSITLNRKLIIIGYYKSIEEAVEARKEAEKKYWE